METLNFFDHQKVIIFLENVSGLSLSYSFVKHLHHCTITVINHAILKIYEFAQAGLNYISNQWWVDSALLLWMSVQIYQQIQKLSILVWLRQLAENRLDLWIWYQHQHQTVHKSKGLKDWNYWNVKRRNFHFFHRRAVSMSNRCFLNEMISFDKVIINMRSTLKMNDFLSVRGLAHVDRFFQLTMLWRIIANLISQVYIEDALGYFTVIFSEDYRILPFKICQKYQNLRRHLCEHVRVITDFLPFTHPNRLKEYLFFFKVCDLQWFSQQTLNCGITGNFSNDFRRVI